jgi:hypothetical protein
MLGMLPGESQRHFHDLRVKTMQRFLMIVTAIFAALLINCATPPPEPQPGMVIIQHNRDGELQVAGDVNWNSYTKVILHTAPVEFRENWVRDHERINGKPFREEDLERLKKGVSDQFNKVMYKALSERGGYDMTSGSGAGVMLFSPSIVDLDIKDPGVAQAALVESVVNSRGSMTIELVITDSESGELMAAAWQQQSDPHAGDLDSTTSVSNTLAFRRMMESHADWLLKGLDKAK